LLADVRITYTKSGIESDLILLERPLLPNGWDASTARLELWHEWNVPGQPRINPRLIYAEANAKLSAAMAEPDLIDQILDFGDLWFPTGAGFATDATQDPLQNEARAVVVRKDEDGMQPVAKTWLASPSAAILVEALKWQSIELEMAGLPESAPSANAPAGNRLECLNDLPAPSLNSNAIGVIKTATAHYQPTGFVLDWTAVPTSSGSYTFSSSITYKVTNATYFGNVIFSPGCVIKFTGTATNGLLIYGSITCNGTSSNPSILTDDDEDLFGEQLTDNFNSCPTTSFPPQTLWAYYNNANLTIQNMRFRYAQKAIRFDANGCGTYTHTVSGCTFVESQTGIYANNSNVTISSSGRSNLTTPTQSVSCGSFFGSLTDIGNTDSDGNHLLDKDDYKYFGLVGTLPGNAAGQLAYHINGHSPSTDQVIWSTRLDNNGPDGTYVYNTSCWLYGVTGITAFSPYNSSYTFIGGGTMITPRHAVVSYHQRPANNATIRFVGSDNVVHVRTVKETRSISTSPSTDYAIMVLNSDLPASVGYVRILPVEVLPKLTAAQQGSASGHICQYQRLPAVGFNQYKEAFIFELTKLIATDAYLSTGNSTHWFPTWDSFCRLRRVPGTPDCGCHSTDIEGGDSGSPTFLLLSNELVLIGPWGGCNTASWQGNYLSIVNQTIKDLDNAHFGAWTGYSATTYPVSGFPPL
jgi:hypothetical protein